MDPPVCLISLGTQIDDPVGLINYLEVVLDDEHGGRHPPIGSSTWISTRTSSRCNPVVGSSRMYSFRPSRFPAWANSATTLSGGEASAAQDLAAELAQAGKREGRKLYILDEPTTGLHLDDVRVLIHVLDRLVDAGHTVLVIEHHLDVIKRADWVIDLGPEAGDAGGQVVAQGTPEEIAEASASHTGRYLQPLLSAGAPALAG